MMSASVQLLHSCPGIKLYDFHCKACSGSRSAVEVVPAFSLVYVRKGNFERRGIRCSLDVYSDLILVEKAGYEYRVLHNHHQPDECMYLELDREFMEQRGDLFRSSLRSFLRDPDQDAMLVPAGPKIHHLHWSVLQAARQKGCDDFRMESMIHELIDHTFLCFTSGIWKPVDPAKKKNYLEAVDAAKAYIHRNFDRPVSIHRIAAHVWMSPFHFSRVFKTFTRLSPYQYLLEVRLKHACDVLLRDKNISVMEAGFAAGFSSPEHFATAFKQRTGMTPSAYRTQQK